MSGFSRNPDGPPEGGHYDCPEGGTRRLPFASIISWCPRSTRKSTTSIATAERVHGRAQRARENTAAATTRKRVQGAGEADGGAVGGQPGLLARAHRIRSGDEERREGCARRRSPRSKADRPTCAPPARRTGRAIAEAVAEAERLPRPRDRSPARTRWRARSRRCRSPPRPPESPGPADAARCSRPASKRSPASKPQPGAAEVAEPSPGDARRSRRQGRT